MILKQFAAFTASVQAFLIGSADAFQMQQPTSSSGRCSTALSAAKIADSVLDIIGDTPLVKLNRVSEGCKAEIVAKLESMNPANSVKDRIALSMITGSRKAWRNHSRKNHSWWSQRLEIQGLDSPWWLLPVDMT